MNSTTNTRNSISFSKTECASQTHKEHTYNTKEGIFIIPSQWKELLGEEVLSLRLTINERCRNLGISPKRLKAYIKDIPEYKEWYSREAQMRISSLKALSPENVEKRIKSCQAKFGGSTPFHDKSIRLKATEASINSPLKNEASERRVKTNIEKYGFASPSSNETVRQKQVETIVRKYGVENLFNTREYQLKAAETFNRNHNSSRRGPLTEEEIKEELAHWGVIPLERVLKRIKFRKFKAKCSKCGKEFTAHFSSGNIFVTTCPFCNLSSTRFERLLVERISKCYKVIPHYRKAFEGTRFSNKEVDIFIPELKLDIEVNGIYSHNSTVAPTTGSSKPKDASYHKDKSFFASQNGIELIHIWEHEPLKSQGLKFLSLRFKNQHLNNLVQDTLRVDFFPTPPELDGFKVSWKPEVLETNLSGDNKGNIITYTAGLWVYTKE